MFIQDASVSTLAYLVPVASMYTVRGTKWRSLSISTFCCKGYARRSDRLRPHRCEVVQISYRLTHLWMFRLSRYFRNTIFPRAMECGVNGLPLI